MITDNNVMIVNDRDIITLIKMDATISKIYQQFGSPPNWREDEGFITLFKIILGQQVSLSAADAHFQKLNNYIGVVSPEHIFTLNDQEMRACFISRQKAKYLRSLSDHVLSGKLIFSDLKSLPLKSVKDKLIAVKGIGD